MSSRASTAERVKFVRRMQQLYPDFDVTDACYYIMAKAATWVRCLEDDEWYWRHCEGKVGECTGRKLAKQRIERRAAEDFPLHVRIVFSQMVSDRYLVFLRDDDRRCVPVPTSKRSRKA